MIANMNRKASDLKADRQHPKKSCVGIIIEFGFYIATHVTNPFRYRELSFRMIEELLD